MNLSQFFSRYGRQAAITLADGGSKTVFAVIMPLRYKNRLYEEGEYTPAGHIDGAHARFISQYIGEAVAPGCTVTASGQQYTVKTWETLYLGEQPAFIRAVLRPEGGDNGSGVF
ncbi:hypothetical protein [Acetanaerobacterium elongatum]|uniref:Uncharacterized protein n=1 Tax=Acetanaerobacterium elongatum TaxID=258515 RepID=A0A1H0ELY3_9FIRM|nr:hypothetical protein [Acetanaerobacterium elongatum]SDN83299.1 hypothetical protein SAMN05192585_13427 [Acetanaerobacterium elongatum]